MTNRPDFVIACDHGIDGGKLASVARFEWSPAQAGISGNPFDGSWNMPLQFSGAVLRVMAGDDPEGYSRRGEAPTRTHYEIPCQEMGCSRRAYRADEADLQRLMTLIVDTRELQAVIAQRFDRVRFDDREAVVTLDALHWARDTARGYGLPV